MRRGSRRESKEVSGQRCATQEAPHLDQRERARVFDVTSRQQQEQTRAQKHSWRRSDLCQDNFDGLGERSGWNMLSCADSGVGMQHRDEQPQDEGPPARRERPPCATQPEKAGDNERGRDPAKCGRGFPEAARGGVPPEEPDMESNQSGGDRPAGYQPD